MPIEVRAESIAALPEYAQVPISFRVETRLRVELLQGGLGGIALVEEPVTPYMKNYDAYPGEGPAHWRELWDLSHWGILSAFDGPRRVGGAAIAWKTKILKELEANDALAALWDLRVHPDYRGQGVGHRLFASVLAWTQARSCRRIMVETQNTNVPACRFYARQGFVLGAIHRYAYDAALDEVQLLWYREV